MLEAAVKSIIKEQVISLKQVREDRLAAADSKLVTITLKNIMRELILCGGRDYCAPEARFVNSQELCAINNLLDYVSITGKISRPRVERDLLRTFQLSVMEDLPGDQFPDALLFLKEWLV